MKRVDLGVAMRRAAIRLHRRMGWSGMAGLALAALASILAALALHMRDAAQAQLVQAQRTQALLAKSTARAHGATRVADLDEALLESLPSFNRNAVDLRSVFAAAQAAGVSLGQGDYTLHAEPGAQTLQFVASFPVHESYANLKSFVAGVLAAVPHAALEDLKASRPDSIGTKLDATIRFTLIYRRGR